MFQAMVDEPIENQQAAMFGHLHPIYGNIGRQPGMQGNPTIVSNIPQVQARQHAPANPMISVVNRPLEVPPQQLHPFLQQPIYDHLEPKGKIKDFKEGGAAVKFKVFNGHSDSDRTKALTFLQQFDTAYTGGVYTEASKIRKASTFLKGNALQWWSNILMQGKSTFDLCRFPKSICSQLAHLNL